MVPVVTENKTTPPPPAREGGGGGGCCPERTGGHQSSYCLVFVSESTRSYDHSPDWKSGTGIPINPCVKGTVFPRYGNPKPTPVTQYSQCYLYPCYSLPARVGHCFTWQFQVLCGLGYCFHTWGSNNEVGNHPFGAEG